MKTIPTIHIHFLEGRSTDKKRKLVEMLTEAVVQSLGVRKETVNIYIHEASKENFGKAGKYRLDGVIP